jgi:DNA-directed RNA polymerase subunit RPC12/RpoP
MAIYARLTTFAARSGLATRRQSEVGRGNNGSSADAADLRTRDAALIRMVCEDCGTVYYSAAARTMVARGERCEKCGGRLVLDERPRPAGPRRRTNGPPAKA